MYAPTNQSFPYLTSCLISISYDTVPSILDFPIPTSDSSEEHPAKRARLTSPNSTRSIAAQITAKSYTDIDELTSDLAAVTSAIIADDGRLASGVLSFQKELEAIIAHENTLNSGSILRSVAEDGKPIKEEETLVSDFKSITSRGSQTVLTIFGIHHQSGHTLWTTPKESGVDNSVLDAFEAVLPERYSTTSVIPVRSLQPKKGEEKAVSLGELFASTHLAPLEAPKQSAHKSNRSSSIGWAHPSNHQPQRPYNPRSAFWDQRLESGKWLSYNVAPAPSQLPSVAGEKRRQRERALSAGEASTELSEEDLELRRLTQAKVQQAKDDALFKSVYSSFAPSYDDTAAVIPHQLRSRLWCHKNRELPDRRLNELYPDVWEDVDAPGSAISDDAGDAEEIIRFKEAVEFFEEQEPSSPWPATSLGDDNPDKDTQEILDEITSLLETLSSHQQIRHESFVHSQNKALAELIGTPTTPSAVEIDLYEMLKNQLTVLIASLPPYAVARLNGGQLDALNISTKIRVQTANHRGTLKPRDAHKVQPQQVVTTPAQVAARPQSVTTPRQPSYQQGVNLHTQSPRHQSFPVPRPGFPQQGYGYTQRPQATPTQYGNYAQPQQQGNRHIVYNGQYAQHASQGTPVQNMNYTNGTRAYATPNPNGYPIQYNNATVQYNATASSPSATRSVQYQGSPRPPQPNFQSRPQPVQGYGGQPSSYHGQQQQQQQGYATPIQTPQRPSYTHGQATMVMNHHPNGGGGTIGEHLALSSTEQEQLIERQKAAIAIGSRQPPRTPLNIGGQPMHATHMNGTHLGGVMTPGQ